MRSWQPATGSGRRAEVLLNPPALEDDIRMHISEGIAPVHIVAAGSILAAAGTGIGLRAMKEEQIPRAALMAAVLFTSTLVIRLPVGPSAVHPLLGGLTGLLLGWASIPVFLVSLFLQALLFQFGGITTLGINTLTMSLPAVAVYYIFGRSISRCRGGRKAFLLGAASGISAYLLSFLIWAGALILCGKQLAPIVTIALLPNMAISVIEGIFTGFAVGFLVRVYPSIFYVPGFPTGRGRS